MKKAAVDFLGTRPFVDRKKIGVLAICGSGGFAISAAEPKEMFYVEE